MLNASSSILCRNLTTGASSTSEDRCLFVIRHAVGGGIVEFEFAADDLFHRLRCGGGRGVDQFENLVVFGNDPVDTELGRELDFFDRFLIRRISRGYGQTVVALAQHDHPVGLANLRIQQTLGQALLIDGIEVHQRRCIGGRHRVRQVGGRDRARTGEFGDEAVLAGRCLAIDVFGRLLAKFPREDQRTAQTGEGYWIGFATSGIDCGHGLKMYYGGRQSPNHLRLPE